MSETESPAARRPLWIPIAVIVLVGGAAVGLTRLVRPSPPKAPPQDLFDWAVATPEPRGEAVAWKGGIREGDEFRGRGTFAYHRGASRSRSSSRWTASRRTCARRSRRFATPA